MSLRVPTQIEKHRITFGPLASDESYGANGAFTFHRRQKVLRVIVSDGGGWEHASASFEDETPSWDDMCFVKKLFWAPRDCVVQYHPAESDYVNFHPHCLHLWRPTDEKMPTPPALYVGPKRFGQPGFGADR